MSEATSSDAPSRPACARGLTAGIYLWLTLEDLTVLDLTLVPALRERGLLLPGCGRVLFWHPSDAGELDYLPIRLG